MKQELKVTLLYTLIGILWIFISDEVILIFMSKNDIESITYFQNIKGTFYILSTALFLYFMLKKHNDAICQKMRELKKNAKALKNTNHELEQYINLASHDLQEPNRTVISFLTNLERKYESQLDDKGKKYIQFATEGAYKMRKIILDLLEYSKINKSGIIENVNLNDTIDEIEEQFKERITETNFLITYTDLPTIKNDSELIQIIFKNLIDNAIKFKKEKEPATITIEAKEKKDNWIFKISDNGIGFEPEYYDKIFVLFQKLNNTNHQGTGSGLAIVKKIVTNLGGTIWVHSEVNKGSNFFLRLPKNE